MEEKQVPEEVETPPAKKKKIVVRRTIISAANTPKMLCEHLLGEEHTHGHRMTFGVIFMVIGVGVSKCFVEIHVLHLICDGIGYALHGMGALPFVERLQQMFREERERQQEKQENS